MSDKSRKCAIKKCKKEEDEYTKLSKKTQNGTKPEDDYKQLLKSNEMKNMNKCYEKKCPNYIRDVIDSQKIIATSACETEKNGKWKKQMCKFASDIKKILDKKRITWEDKTKLNLKFNKLMFS
jgi:hypothetical protein